MSGNRVAKRYARALFKMSDGDMKQGAAFASALDMVASLFELAEARNVLRSPVMPIDLKLSLLNFALKKAHAPEAVHSFVEHTVNLGRATLFPEIAEQFRELLNEARGVLTAYVKSAIPLTSADLKGLTDLMQTKFGKKIEILPVVDPSIQAGLWIGVGNTVIDLTLRTRLSALVSNASS